MSFFGSSPVGVELFVAALVVGVPDGPFAAVAHGAASAGHAGLVIDGAVVAGLGVEIGLVAADAVGVGVDDLRAELHAGVAVGRGELVAEVQLEIGRLHRGEDEEGLLGAVLGFMAADDAVFHRPEAVESLPVGEVRAVEQRDEAVGVGRGQIGRLVGGAERRGGESQCRERNHFPFHRRFAPVVGESPANAPRGMTMIVCGSFSRDPAGERACAALPCRVAAKRLHISATTACAAAVGTRGRRNASTKVSASRTTLQSRAAPRAPA